MVFGLFRQRSSGESSLEGSDNADTVAADLHEMRLSSQQTLRNDSVERTVRNESGEGLLEDSREATAPSTALEGDTGIPADVNAISGTGDTVNQPGPLIGRGFSSYDQFLGQIIYMIMKRSC